MKINPTKLPVLLVCLLFIFSDSFSQKSRIISYVEQYKSLAIEEMIRTGIPASITLAQGLLETGFGESDLALNANNHFGIKCKGEWTGDRIYHDDDTKGECFRKYKTAIESYRDHSDFLRNRPHYASLFNLDITDYQGWAKGLKAAGYATNPQYPRLLIKLIEENNLHQYTLLALNQAPANPAILLENKIETATAQTEDVEPVEQPTISELPSQNVIITPVVSANSNSYPEGFFTINETKVIFAEAGTSLFALATNNNISYNKLLEFNDLGKVDIIAKGQLIFLQKKQKRGNTEIHIVEANENLHDICQKEGIQLSSLIEFNNFSRDRIPSVGERIYLKAPSSLNSKAFISNTSMHASPTMR